MKKKSFLHPAVSSTCRGLLSAVATASALATSRAVARVGLGAMLGFGMMDVSLVAAAPDPRAIMEQVATTRKLDASEAVVKMTKLNKAGQSQTLQLKMATKLFDGGQTEKRVYKFLSGDEQGTGVLVWDYASKDDETWVFLPALRKVRRIVSSARSRSFMGSEFSYADINVPTLDDFSYAVVKEEAAGGEPCYLVEVKPKSDAVAEGEGYSKKLYWVSKASHVIRKGLYYDLDGVAIKELTTSNVKLLDPQKKRYRAMRMEMVNKKNGRRSIFETVKVSATAKPADAWFEQAYLERN